jgi:hypothetical protein
MMHLFHLFSLFGVTNRVVWWYPHRFPSTENTEAVSITAQIVSKLSTPTTTTELNSQPKPNFLASDDEKTLA